MSPKIYCEVLCLLKLLFLWHNQPWKYWGIRSKLTATLHHIQELLTPYPLPKLSHCLIISSVVDHIEERERERSVTEHSAH